MSVRAPRGPGDPDPRFTVSTAAAVAPPLGPGDVDPRSSSAAPAVAVRSPLGPGELSDGSTVQEMPPVPPPARPGDQVGPDSEFEVRAVPAFGPGDLAVPRPAIRRPIRR